MNIGIIVLAAGSSTRMGKSKQLLPVHGEPLLSKSIQAALESNAGSVIVVLGANAKAHREIIKDLDVEVVENSTWEKGMGSSLKTGLSHLLLRNPATDAVIIMVCDQPAVTSAHVKELLTKYHENKKQIVASYYSNSPGVPALIGKKFFPELLQLEDSQGAKKIIQRHNTETELVPFPEGAIDLDTPEDYNNYIKPK